MSPGTVWPLFAAERCDLRGQPVFKPIRQALAGIADVTVGPARMRVAVECRKERPQAIVLEQEVQILLRHMKQFLFDGFEESS